jgi:hypothetical protein
MSIITFRRAALSVVRAARWPLQRSAGVLLAALCGLMASPASPAWAAQPGAQSDAAVAVEATYQNEKAACLNGSSSQDRATCLKEAGAARAQARQHTLEGGDTAADRKRNALARCGVVAPADKADCERLARGEGRRDGSVSEGAVYKELTTRTVGPLEMQPAVPAASDSPR